MCSVPLVGAVPMECRRLLVREEMAGLFAEEVVLLQLHVMWMAYQRIVLLALEEPRRRDGGIARAAAGHILIVEDRARVAV